MTQCYGFRGTEVTTIGTDFFAPCPSGNGCCAIGDICLEDHICHFTHPPTTSGNFSGYYIGACTDPTYTDPACSKHCTDLGIPDVVYNSTSGQWACCGVDPVNGVKCQNPTTEVFSAPARDELTTILPSSSTSGLSVTPTETAVSETSTISTSSSVSITVAASLSISSAAPTSLAFNTTSISRAPAPSSTLQAAGTAANTGLTAGAKAALGISAGIGLLLLLLFLAFIIPRRRKVKMRHCFGRGRNPIRTVSPPPPVEVAELYAKVEYKPKPLAELEGSLKHPSAYKEGFI